MFTKMKSSNTSPVRGLITFPVAGATIGLLVFLAVALLPSLLYGGVAGVQLASGIFGVPDARTFGGNAFIVLGIVFAVTAVASLFAAFGAVAGASVDALTRATGSRPPSVPEQPGLLPIAAGRVT
jgi:succinate-acetate transporter protein